MEREKLQLYRVVKKQPGEKRRPHQMSFSDREYSDIVDMAHNYGFKRPADFLIALSEFETIEDGFESFSICKVSSSFMPVKTLMNQIDCGINVEDNTQKIIKEVKALCREFR